jgi:hypothetical protein
MVRTMSEQTDGQLAYEAWRRTYTPDEDWSPPPWAHLTDADRADWEAIAAAASAAAHERTAELVSEVNELRARLLALADHWNREYASETGWPSHCAAELREALATPEPAVAFAGAEHLAELIGSVANADEAP